MKNLLVLSALSLSSLPGFAAVAAVQKASIPSPQPSPQPSPSAKPAADSPALTRKSADEEAAEKAEFLRKLQEMLTRTEESVKLMRDQITKSQSAPFLAELYMELADLLAQKSNALYYLQMEKRKSAEISKDERAFSPVIQAQKEAIEIYRRILTDFPKSAILVKAKFRLAVSLKSIDEVPEFLKVASALVRESPKSEEAMRAQIMLGQHFFENGDFPQARIYLTQVMQTSALYEKNLAKYRLGLIDLAEDRYREALTKFEEVISEKGLTPPEGHFEISLESRQAKTDLRREALIDSVRAYTRVFEKDPDPVTYYSKLAPTEILFQEVIEKLALRFIHLKKYDQAVKLFRTMSERIADPQKVITIYREVLLMIPPSDRITIPVAEMRFVLERYSHWISFYEVPPKLAKETYVFFEKHIRELGTAAHSLAKEQRDPATKRKLMDRAADLYTLYISFFNKGAMLAKMATNFADVRFAQQEFLAAGEFYLRTFTGEFGPVGTNARALIENAILCLQRPEDRGYYENIRRRGLLINAIQTYVGKYPERRKDPRVVFTALKAMYEQSLFPETLDRLYAFIKNHPASPQAVNAGELILDYYNIRNDFTELDKNAGRLQAMRLPQPAFNAKLANTRKLAKARVVQDKVRAISGYDDFSQGKSYLAAALQSGDSVLASEVLNQALARSKAERDIKTFLDAGSMMAAKEADLAKRGAILRSVAREQIRVAQFYDANLSLQKMAADPKLPPAERQKAFEESLNVALLLRDWDLSAKLLATPPARGMSSALQTRLRDQTVDLLGSGVKPPPAMSAIAFAGEIPADALRVLFRSQSFIDANTRQRVSSAVNAVCAKDAAQAFCVWGKLPQMDQRIAQFTASLATTPPSIEGLQMVAQRFMQTSQVLQAHEGTGDPALDGAVAARSFRLYSIFANFLLQMAGKSPDLKPVLEQKAQETTASARVYLERCRSVPVTNPFCESARAPLAADLVPEPRVAGGVAAPIGKDPTDERLEELRKDLFASKDEARTAFELAREFYRKGLYHHAAAMSSTGAASYADYAGPLKTVLGCSVIHFGLVSEARFHLKDSEEVDGMKARCLAEIGSNARPAK